MKNLFGAALLTAALFAATTATAKTNVTDSTFKHKVSTTVKTVGHKTSHAAATGASAIVDKKYEGKCGPNGQTVYIDKYSHYYYISKKGHRVYLKKSELMDKAM